MSDTQPRDPSRNRVIVTCRRNKAARQDHPRVPRIIVSLLQVASSLFVFCLASFSSRSQFLLFAGRLSLNLDRFLRWSRRTTSRSRRAHFPAPAPFRAYIHFTSICKPRPLETASSVIPNGVAAVFLATIKSRSPFDLQVSSATKKLPGSLRDGSPLFFHSTGFSALLVCGRFFTRRPDTSQPRFDHRQPRYSRGDSKSHG